MPRHGAEEVRTARGELDKKETSRSCNRGITLEMVDPPITGNVEGLCLLADFSDQVATIPRGDVVDYCNQVGYTGYGNNGSVRDYFLDVLRRGPDVHQLGVGRVLPRAEHVRLVR